MSDHHVEKKFLYLLLFSAMLHLGAYLFIMSLPQEQPKSAHETTFVDIADLPDLAELTPSHPLPEKEAPETEVKRHAGRRQRVERETAPRGTDVTDRPAPQRSQQALPSPPSTRRLPEPAAPVAPAPEQSAAPPVARGEGILKPRASQPQLPDRAKLFPSAAKLARLEDGYREKYRREVDEGAARFLNTDDILFGSFLRRLEISIYGVWRYPQAALMRGIEGTTPVKITFNRKGEIMRVDVLESSGSKILDDEVLRTLKELGPIGSFPKGYQGEYFNLIAFFHYGNGSGRLR